MNQLVLGAYSHFNDYMELTKPRIALLVLFTTFVGMYLAAGGSPPADIILFTLFGTGLAAASSGALNHYIDRDIDPLMLRTMSRPLASGRVSEKSVLFFGLGLGALALAVLVYFVNPLTAALAAFTILFYTLVYSVWLKRRSHWCTEIGGIAGAVPPLIGWSAVTESLSITAVLLFLLLFLWQPPHFWALALLRSEEYRRANIPMLPVVKGEQATKLRTLIYTVALLPCCILLCYVNQAPLPVYLGGIAVNAIYIVRTLKFYRAPVSRTSSMGLFGYSILYIFMLFGLALFLI